MAESLRVLHVTETFSAGTGTAVVGFARALQRAGIESWLLAQDRGSGLFDSLPDHPFTRAEVVPQGLTRLWSAVGHLVPRWQPDLVHVHSSLAGAVARARIRLLRHRPVVIYSPHCFAFERQDLSAPARRAMWLAEWALARVTDAYVCVSPHEAELAAGLRRRLPSYTLVNRFAATAIDDAERPEIVAQQETRLVSVGRIAPQKDPTLFLAVLEAVRSTGLSASSVSATWIGDGPDHRAELDSAGVEITGWLPPHDVHLAMAGGIYVHTAAWEAAVPLAILDAMEAGLPVVARRLPAYRDMIPAEWQFDTPAQAATMITQLQDPHRRAARVAAQQTRLTELYRRGPDSILPEAYRDVIRRARS